MSETSVHLSDLAPAQIRDFLRHTVHQVEGVFFVFDAFGELLLSFPDTDDNNIPANGDARTLDAAYQIALSGLTSADFSVDGPYFVEVLHMQEKVLGVLVGWFGASNIDSQTIPFIKTIMRLIRSRMEEFVRSQSELDELSAAILENYRELGFIHRLSTELAGLEDIQRVYNIVLSQVMEAVEADCGCIFKHNKVTGELRQVLCYPDMLDTHVSEAIPTGDGLIREVAETREPLLIDDITHPTWQAYADFVFPPPLMCCASHIGQDSLHLLFVSRNTSASVFTSGDLKILEAAAIQAALAMMNVTFLETLQQSQDNLEDNYQQTLLAMTSLLELRDQETEYHSTRVVRFAMRIAEEMGVINEDQLRIIELGATLHDIGKIGVPDAILLKPGGLTDDERREMQKHTFHGYDVLKNIPFIGAAALIVLHHHEFYNGTGYPKGLKGEDIPLGARIFKVADVFDALASRRPYKEPWPYQKIREELINQSGSEFDPRVIEAFLKIPSQEWEDIRIQSQSSAK